LAKTPIKLMILVTGNNTLNFLISNVTLLLKILDDLNVTLKNILNEKKFDFST
jgi:hypothetical protein